MFIYIIDSRPRIISFFLMNKVILFKFIRLSISHDSLKNYTYYIFVTFFSNSLSLFIFFHFIFFHYYFIPRYKHPKSDIHSNNYKKIINNAVWILNKK